VDVKIGNAVFHALRTGLVAVAVLLLADLALADTIKLKNGSVIKGKVVTYIQQEFTIILDLGPSSRRSSSRMTIAAEDVESIEFDSAETSSAAPATETLRESAPVTRQPATEPDPRPVEPAVTEKTSPPVAAPETTDPAPTTTTGGGAVIAERDVRVIAGADWTSSEIRVQRGQRVSISASGEIDLGNGQKSNPNGTSINDRLKLLANRPTGALIAVIGDDNDDFIFVGRTAEFTAAHNGILFLSVNEGNLKDNGGYYTAKVRVMEK
jgi:hypothetical protein